MGFQHAQDGGQVELDTLLVVRAKERETAYLAVSAGCWVKRKSHVKRDVMTVVFMMNHVGYPVLGMRDQSRLAPKTPARTPICT